MVFTSVKEPNASYKITAATRMYNLNAEVVVPDKPLVGRVLTITLDPPETTKK